MPTNFGPTVNAITSAARSSTTTHRSAITAVDKLVVAALTSVADQAGVVGVMANAEHKCAYAPGNVYGSAGASAIATVTPTLNKTVDFTIAAVTGATYYDIFFSTDAAPLWVGRVTEAQRAAGCAITAVGTVGAGGSAGIVNVRLVGTGLATTSPPFSINNGYYPDKSGITPITCRGYNTAIVSVQLAVTDLRALPTLILIPFLSKNDGTPTVWYQGTATDLAPGSAIRKSLYQYYTVDVRDATNMVILVDTISGQGSAVTVYVDLV